ncbi:MAG: flavin reductase family protein [Caldilineaceae bacterium]|nr:flavin reductase family protein [Caldilineaceae bacterium]
MNVDVQTFKDTLAHWASGVTVVTTVANGHYIGITASSLTSVSLSPPQILICVARKLYTHAAIEESGVFAVNILSTEQLEWGMRFAGLIPEVEDRFAGIDWTTGTTGCPLLPGVLGWLDCRVRHAYEGGDHTIYVGEVLAASARDAGAPLLYFKRSWRQLAEPTLQPPV